MKIKKINKNNSNIIYNKENKELSYLVISVMNKDNKYRNIQYMIWVEIK